MIEVCCAIILNDDKMLAVQRGPESSHPWQWEFPGGKVYPGEAEAQCVVREIEEELKVRIQVITPLLPVGFDYGMKQISLMPFVCKIISGEICLTEHVGLHWFDIEEWKAIDWSGADRELILKNQEQLVYQVRKNKGESNKNGSPAQNR